VTVFVTFLPHFLSIELPVIVSPTDKKSSFFVIRTATSVSSAAKVVTELQASRGFAGFPFSLYTQYAV